MSLLNLLPIRKKSSNARFILCGYIHGVREFLSARTSFFPLAQRTFIHRSNEQAFHSSKSLVSIGF